MELRKEKLQLLICISGFLDLFGVAMVYPLLTHHAKSLGASPSQVGYFGSIYGFLQFFSSPLMGQISDHIGRKRTILISLIGTATSYFALGLCGNIAMLSLARIPSGLFKQSQSLNRTYLADINKKHERSSIFGLFNSISSLGFIIGPTVGGYLTVTENGFTKVATLSSFIFLLNFSFMYCVIPQSVSKKANAGEFDLLSCFNAFKDINRIPWHAVWDAFAIKFLMSFSMIVFRANFTSVLVYRFNTDPIINGYIISFNGMLAAATGVCVRWIVPYFKSNATLHNTFAVIMVSSLISITVSPSLHFVLISLIPLCIASAVLRVTSATSVFNKANMEILGLIYGLSGTMTSLARALGPLIGGYAQEISIYGPGICGTILAVLGTLVGFYSSMFQEKVHRE